ncbi:PAS domain-containing sensor histidine kinase [Xanthobacter sp. 91]|uniref:hybrid sensor histidine kinase/response regulator n=1 Tax=Xanthobacter sp. 91 TaxID=1117244 RepID=UPI0006897157|nr:PAS domain-containing sensor histidine kinase [Xanthobacter sp. 91]
MVKERMRGRQTKDQGTAVRRRKSRGAGPLGTRLFIVVFALAGGFVGATILGRDGGGVPSAIIAALAVVGVVELFLAARRAFKGVEPEDPLGAIALAASGDAMAVVEDGERIVETNPAYLRMCRSGTAEPPLPERFLSRIPGSQTTVGELLNAVAGSTAHLSTMPFGGGARGRQLEVSVHPVGGPRRVLWTLRMVDTAEAEAAPAFAPAPVPAPAAHPVAPFPAAPLPVAPLPVAPVVAKPLPVAPAVRPPDPVVVAPAPAVAAPVPVSEARAPAPSPTAPEGYAGPDLVASWEELPAGLLRIVGGRVVDPNLTFCRMLGYALADWGPDGMPLSRIVAPESMPALAAAQANGGRASLVASLKRKDGTALPVLLRIAAAPDGTGAVALPLDAVEGALGASARTTAPQAPKSDSTEVLGDLFFRRAPLAMALVDRSGGVRAANAAFERLFGRDAAGRPLTALVADASGTEALLAAAAGASEPPAPCDVTLAGGSARSVRFYAAPLDVSGDIALCAIDMTEQRALEVQFAQSQKLQAVGHLAGGVAHDFNNVLTAIIGYCDLLLAKHRPSDPSFPDIMQIKQNANRAAGLVRQLLAFSRRQTLRPQVIELGDVISDAAALLRRLIGERITLDVEHARDLWPVKVDVNQFEQVIVNLAVNARDAMPDGGTLTIRTGNVPAAGCAAYGQGLPEGDYVMVEVADTGTGIPPDIMDKIFEPFFSTKEVGKGTGLGLSTVYGIVQQTGGTILADSEMGHGTTFRVFLPRHLAGIEPEEAPRPAEPEPKAGDTTGQGRRVLLVEDEDAVRAFASRALANRGYEVLAAASGVEALELIEREGKVDLVISDVVMPEMDGPTLLRELRSREPGLKVIFISGYAEEAFARNLPPSEHFSFLPKPFSLKQLVAAVSETLRA